MSSGESLAKINSKSGGKPVLQVMFELIEQFLGGIVSYRILTVHITPITHLGKFPLPVKNK